MVKLFVRQHTAPPLLLGGPDVICSDVKQPVPNAYVIVVVPADIPVTSPTLSTVATDVLLLFHTPAPESDKVVTKPIYT